MRFVYILIPMLFMNTILNAQTVLENKIVDSINGEPIPYSTVKIKNSNFGTYADSLGVFKLNLKSPTDSITVSSIGYYSKTIIVNDKLDRSKPILLSPNMEILDEVVVKNYDNKGKWSKPFKKNKISRPSLGFCNTILFEGTTLKSKYYNLNRKINGIRFKTQLPSADMSVVIRPVITNLDGESLLTKDYTQTFYFKYWKKSDLEFEFREDVVLPEEGVYIGMEVISVPDNNNYEKAVGLMCASDEDLNTEITTIQNYMQQSGMVHNFDKTVDGGLYIEIKRPK